MCRFGQTSHAYRKLSVHVFSSDFPTSTVFAHRRDDDAPHPKLRRSTAYTVLIAKCVETLQDTLSPAREQSRDYIGQIVYLRGMRDTGHTAVCPVSRFSMISGAWYWGHIAWCLGAYRRIMRAYWVGCVITQCQFISILPSHKLRYSVYMRSHTRVWYSTCHQIYLDRDVSRTLRCLADVEMSRRRWR